MSNFKKFMSTLLVAVVALLAEFVFHQPKIAFWLIVVVGGMTTISMFIGMIKTLKSGKYGVDILAITAIIATLLVGEYWASLMILIMLTGGDSLEDYASRQASRELRSLLDNSPQIAHRVVDNQVEDIPVDQVEIDDLILVKPSEIVPVDGIIVEGETMVDESSLTGESKPVEKKVDDTLMSGTINGDAAIRFKVTKRAIDSQYQSLVKLVRESEAKPAHFVRLADRYAVPFTLTAYFIGGVAWFVSKDPVRFAEVLVVASPCPLILAAPVALVAGMSRSSRNGIVVKTGTTIEKLAKAKSIAFDKTGTLTEGKLFVDAIHVAKDSYSEEQLLQYAISAEQESNHILARSLVEYGKSHKVDLFAVKNLEEVTGQGIEATVNDQSVHVGKAKFAGTTNEVSVDQTVVYIAINKEYAGYITFKDTVRPESKATIQQLNELGIHQTVMLTGDHQSIAEQIGRQVGISDIHANCLPEEKIEVLKKLEQTSRPVIMVGDGVNDVLALTVADVGIAMGATGSTAASESADAVILKDDLTRVAEAVRLSKDTMRIARQSVLIGLLICVVLMLIASTGVIPALIGAVLQEVVDTVSILSALRARRELPLKV